MAATILTATNLTQRFGSELIFSAVSFQMTERERIGLVGTNGSGKSSLMKIVAGLAEPAEGTVSRASGLRVAYQAQEPRFDSDRSLVDEALEAFRDVREIGQRMSELEQLMADKSDGELDALFDEYSSLSTEFESRHGYDMEFRTAQVLSGLGFPESMFDEPVAQLSGGQKTRVSLAKTLLSDPDLLLLDEPTNHLDLTAIEWLEGFLSEWNRAYIVISHDRYFLDRTTDRTLEMAFGGIEDYPGGYSRYLKLRTERRERRQKEYEEQQAFIRHTEEFIRKYKAGQRSREARGRETRLARLDRIEAPQDHARLNLTMRASQRSGRIVLSADPLTIGFPASNGSKPTVLATTDELIIERGDRVAIVGPNGSGKTTALRTIVGEIEALGGSVSFGTNVKPAYYAQGHDGLDRSRTALETILHDQPMGEEQARNLLGRFLFSNDDVYKRVSQLSGGERSRLALARLTLEKANLLILDEPTNHLDILARETLEEALGTYDGTLLFVSHDRFFIDSLASRVWVIEENRLSQYLGNYSDMLRARDRLAESGDQPVIDDADTGRSAERPDTRRNRGPRRQLDKELRAARKRLSVAERAVGKLESLLNDINDAISLATADQDAERLAVLGTQYEQAQGKLDQVYDEWSRAGAELDELVKKAEEIELEQRA